MTISDQELSWLRRDKYHGQVDEVSLAADIKRVENGEPLAYVIGWMPFLGYRIELDQRPLIPRPETEYWVEKVIAEIGKDGGLAPKTLLDLCCGSGCIGIAVKKAFPSCEVEAADISNAALQQTQHNFAINHIEAKKIIKSDLFAEIDGKFDFIFCNPPYIPGGEKLEKSLDFEPKEALFSGEDGLDVIERFLKKLPSHLKANGKAWMEFGKGQEKAIEVLIAQHELPLQAHFFPDQFGIIRWVKLTN